MSLQVLHPGTFSLLVDRGRTGSRSRGVPLGGAADVAAYQIGNALVGNPNGALALEITLSGPQLVAECDVSACVFGAPFSIDLAGRPMDTGRVFRLRAGETLRIGGTNRGARGYLCVAGGFQAREILGSASAFTPIAAGDRLACSPSSTEGTSLAHPDTSTLFNDPLPANIVRVVDGAQLDWFSPDQFYDKTYYVSAASNRMGIRLDGEPLVRHPREMISEAVAPGAIQIANDQRPIVLGVEGQTIGGYPKIAHVIGADLDRLGQLRPGQTVRFQRVSLDEAEKLAVYRRKTVLHWLTALALFASIENIFTKSRISLLTHSSVSG